MPIGSKAVKELKVPGRLTARPAAPVASVAGSVGTLDDLVSIMGHHSPVSAMSRPRLCLQGIDLQGVPKTCKSTLLAGCPQAYINKYADGEPRARRSKAFIDPVKSLKQLDENTAKLLAYARKYSTNGQYCMVGHDPLSTLWEMLATDEVRLWNEYQAQRYEDQKAAAAMNAKSGKATLLNKPPVPVRDVSEIPEYGTYGTIARIFFAKYIRPFAELGWGWCCVTHYRAKPVFEDGKPIGAMTWQPSLAPTTAEIISQNADLLLKADKKPGDGGKPIFFLEFQSVNAEGIGSRYPLYGTMQLSNYDNPKTPKAITVWDELEDVFEQAVDAQLMDQAAFQAALNDQVQS